MTIDQARRLQLLARWHRRVALVAVVWILILAFTGVLINHANDWGLDRTPIAGPLQSLLYGVGRKGEDFCGRSAELGPRCEDIFAALPLPDGALLLERSSVYLLDARGGLLEQLPAAQLDLEGILGGMVDGTRVYLRDARRVIRTDPELLGWQVLDAAAAKELAERDWQVDDGAGSAITWERFLLDLHAARFLGPLAKAFTDLMAGFILLLGLSGAWLWWLKRRRD